MNKHYIKLIILQALWAGNMIVGQLAIENTAPFFLLIVRFFIISILYFCLLTFKKKIYLWKKKEFTNIHAKIWVWLFITGAIGVSIYFVLVYRGMSQSNATYAGLITHTTQPLFSIILSSIFLKEAVSKKSIIVLCLGLIGTLMILFPYGIHLIDIPLVFGNLLFLLAGGAYAIFNIGVSKISSFAINLTKAIVLFSIISMLCLLPFPFIFGEKIASIKLFDFCALLSYLLFTSIIALLWWNAALREIGVARTSVFTFLIAPFTIIESYLIFGQKPTFIAIIGGLITLLSVFISKNLKKEVRLNKKESHLLKVK